MKKLIKYFSHHPHKLLLLDFTGALTSAFMLGVVLVHWQGFFGIPILTLYMLAAVPCLFAAYDIFIYSSKSKNPFNAIRNIAYLNMGYCLFSLFVALFHASIILVAGWIYLGAEILIVLYLARLELNVAATDQSEN